MLIFQCRSYYKGSRTQQLQYKPIADIIQNNFVYFYDFMCSTYAVNDRKLK
jgi:hypothetical protein